MSARQFHPVAEIFPLLDEPGLVDLADDIKANGLREAIWLHRDGRIVDGRNRFQACTLAGVEPTFRTYEGTDTDLGAFVVSLNLHRRHLDESQRAIVAGKIATLAHGGDRSKAPIGALTQAQAADLLNVGERSVERAATVLKTGVPELVHAVESGIVSVSAAAKIAAKPPVEQRRVVQLPTASEARKIARETKRPVEARDGKVYNGRTREQVQADVALTAQISQLTEALEALATMPVKPGEYIAQLPDYMIPAVTENFAAAAQWFDEFKPLWRARHEGRELASSGGRSDGPPPQAEQAPGPRGRARAVPEGDGSRRRGRAGARAHEGAQRRAATRHKSR